MRIVFMGTPSFAVPSLQTLMEDFRHEVVGIVTQPDRVNRRGRKIAFSPVKEWALHQGRSVFQPLNLHDNESLYQLRFWNPDIFVVVAYGKILSKEVLRIPKYGCLNVHASLLPKYRGASPIQYSIWNGDPLTGVTIMRMDEGMDTGDILTQEAIPLDVNDDVLALTDKLSVLGARILSEVLHDFPRYLSTIQVQDHNIATYTQKIQKKDGHVDWNRPAVKLRQLVNALHSNPGVYTSFRGRRLKLHRVTVVDKSTTAIPGRILQISEQGIYVATGKGVLVLELLQPESKKQMTALDFVNGYQVQAGEQLGEPQN